MNSLFITFLVEPELINLLTVKWFLVFLALIVSFIYSWIVLIIGS